MNNHSELLVSLSENELEALADGNLAPSSQARIDALLEKNASESLDGDEAKELDLLLSRVDQLNILKTRARLTLKQHAEAARQ